MSCAASTEQRHTTYDNLTTRDITTHGITTYDITTHDIAETYLKGSDMENQHRGVPASELTDEELESQGKQAHDTRNWVFLHGSAEQFAHHTERMLDLEQEYLKRHPKRTWQGRAGEVVKAADDPVGAFLSRIVEAGGRMNKLEAHHAAREVGLERAAVADLYKASPPLITTEGQDRVITDEGRGRATSS